MRTRLPVVLLILVGFALGFASSRTIFVPAMAQQAANCPGAGQCSGQCPGMNGGMMGQGMMGQGTMGQGMMGGPMMNGSNADRGLMNAMMGMRQGMAQATYTGNMDHDFVAMMIPHHQGAIDSAQLELQSGKDPSIRALAAKIVKAQQDEIALMSQWLAKHP